MRVFKTAIKFFLLSVAFLPWAAQAEMTIELQERRDGALRLFNVPAITDISADIAPYLDDKGAIFLDWSDDGEMLIARRADEVTQLFTLDSPFADPQQISFSNQAVGRGFFAHFGSTAGVVLSQDQNGDESYQYYFQDFERSPPQLLTPQAGRNSNAVLSNQSHAIAYTRAQDEQSQIWGVLQSGLDLAKETQLIFQDPGAWAVLDWSPDDQKLLILNFNSIHDSILYIADVATGIKAPFDVSDTPKGYSGAQFSSDGKGVYFLSSAQDGFHHLSYQGFNGERRDYDSTLPWSLTDFDVSPDGRHLATIINEGGIFKLQIRDLISGDVIYTPKLPHGQLTNIQFNPDGASLGFTMDAAARGRGAYSLDVESRVVTRWDKDGRSDVLSDVTSFSYPSFDTVDGKPRHIPGLIYKPEGPGPHPIIIRFHGGPEGQWVANYSSTTQYWVNALGIAVIQPNVRGSTGYGADFAALDNGLKREDAVKDVGALLDWIARQPDLDADRIMVQGGSYGGYMSLASLVHYSDRLRGGIDSVGISNFVTFLESTGSFRRELRRVEYGDESDPETRAFLNRISPLTQADKITKPLLIAQGANDPRVPETESRQMVNAIADRGGVIWYVLAEDEGHGFERRFNRDMFNAVSTAFIKKYLLDGSAERLNAEAD